MYIQLPVCKNCIFYLFVNKLSDVQKFQQLKTNESSVSAEIGLQDRTCSTYNLQKVIMSAVDAFYYVHKVC